jgi:hypothetical protein
MKTKLELAAPDLLAACICEQALERHDRQRAIRVLISHGWNGEGRPHDFVDRLRINAIKKATE